MREACSVLFLYAKELLRYLQRGLGVSVAVFAMALVACHGIQWSELDFTRHRPSRADLIGKWVPTPVSLRDMKERGGYAISKHELDLHADGTFSVINMPDWWNNFGGESHRTLQSGSGVWSVQQEDDGVAVWLIYLDFVDRHRISLNLRHQKPPYSIHIMLGDPDTGRAMLLKQAPQ